MTNLASTPIWSEAAALVGSNLAAAAIAAAVTAMQGDIDPAQDNRGPNDFKRHVAKLHVKLTVNGKPVEALVEPWLLLLHYLREELGLTGPHIGCETSHCGACSIDLIGCAVTTCTVFSAQANGAEITTIEGLKGDAGDGMHPLQEMFREHHGLQCGYCTPGMITPAPGACCRRIRTRPRRKSAWA